MSAYIRPYRYVVFRLPSDALKIVEIVPNTLVSIGKFGSFPANLLLGRPLYATYEIHDTTDPDTGDNATKLVIVPAEELNREARFDTVAADENEDDSGSASPQPEGPEDVLIKDNRNTVDDASRQTLSMYEIEDLKKAVTGSGREVIEKIMSAHKNLDEKTAFSLAKYTLRKMKKYLRRFTVLPMDAARLAEYMTWSREASRIMEFREESLGLVNAWANVHVTPQISKDSQAGKWLVIDDTGGLLVASIAEKLGLLDLPDDPGSENGMGSGQPQKQNPEEEKRDEENGEEEDMNQEDGQGDESMPDAGIAAATSTNQAQVTRPYSRRHPFHAPVSNNNAIYVLHPASQPNLSLLKYFNYSTTHPDPQHPLSRHLLPLSWLQLVAPEQDAAYAEPPKSTHEELEQMKPSKRSAYYRKRRRWTRCKDIVDSARAGEFDGLICSTSMQASSFLKYLVPLVKGGGHVVIYSPTIEQLEQIVDLYSKERKATFISQLDAYRASSDTSTPAPRTPQETSIDGVRDPASWKDNAIGTSRLPEGFVYDEDDFPVDPRLLLGCSIVTSRARQWQVLPGRTHPMMTSRGGGEGYIFTARRALPFEGKVEARGKFSKKRKLGA